MYWIVLQREQLTFSIESLAELKKYQDKDGVLILHPVTSDELYVSMTNTPIG